MPSAASYPSGISETEVPGDRPPGPEGVVFAAYRVTGGIPARDLHFAAFQPTFLYELIWDLALAAFLAWLGHRAAIRPWGLFAL